MCGRYTLTADADALVEAFDCPDLTFTHRPRYNIAPSQAVPVLARDRRGVRMGRIQWGFVPAGRPAARPLINARAESAADRPSFRQAFRRRRCLVPADGFYEWRKAEGRSTPFWFHRPDGGLFAFAGIWERRPDGKGGYRYGFAILTTRANGDVAPIHARMPAIVPPGLRHVWLDPSAAGEALRTCLAPAEAGSLLAHPVSTRVNAPGTDDPDLIRPVDAG